MVGTYDIPTSRRTRYSVINIEDGIVNVTCRTAISLYHNICTRVKLKTAYVHFLTHSEYGTNKYCFNQLDDSTEYQRWKKNSTNYIFYTKCISISRTKIVKLLKWVFGSRKSHAAQTIQWPIEHLQKYTQRSTTNDT